MRYELPHVSYFLKGAQALLSTIRFLVNPTKIILIVTSISITLSNWYLRALVGMHHDYCGFDN